MTFASKNTDDIVFMILLVSVTQPLRGMIISLPCVLDIELCQQFIAFTLGGKVRVVLGDMQSQGVKIILYIFFCVYHSINKITSFVILIYKCIHLLFC